MVEKNYDWSGKTGKVLLKETKDFIIALESLGYSEKQIIKELKSNGNIPKTLREERKTTR